MDLFITVIGYITYHSPISVVGDEWKLHRVYRILHVHKRWKCVIERGAVKRLHFGRHRRVINGLLPINVTLISRRPFHAAVPFLRADDSNRDCRIMHVQSGSLNRLLS